MVEMEEHGDIDDERTAGAQGEANEWTVTGENGTPLNNLCDRWPFFAYSSFTSSGSFAKGTRNARPEQANGMKLQ